VLCPSVCGVMVNCQCVLYIGWNRYSEIVAKVIIGTYESNIKKYIKA